MLKLATLINLVKADNNGSKLFIHKLVSEQDARFLLENARIFKNVNEDYFSQARILSNTNTTLAYRINNEVYLIPATIKAVVNNGDGVMGLWFDYPCAMLRSDLTEY